MKYNTQQPNQDYIDSSKSVRIHHHRLDKEYSVIANHGVENPRLSYAAQGLLWYMLSRESSFEIHTWHLSKKYEGEKRGSGIEAVRGMLDELKEEGYLTYRKYRGAKGQWEHRYDIYPIPVTDFQKKFPERVKACMDEAYTDKPSILPITELPITKNPPLSSPPKKSETVKSSKKSLRSEEEESSIFEFLEGTSLSQKEKVRLTKSYPREEVLRALKISETQTIKKTLMHLLITILTNPDKWPDAEQAQLQTHQQRIAHEYNERLRKSKNVARDRLIKPGANPLEMKRISNAAYENDTTIPMNYMQIVLDGYITQVSLKSVDFGNDIKEAMQQLK